MSQSEPKSEQLPRTSALKPILFIVLTLISGIIIGAGMMLIVKGSPTSEKTLPPAPEYMSGRMIQRIARELKLPPEQQEQLGPILQKHMKAMDDIRLEARPKIMEEIKQMNDEIMAILDEQQQQLWQDQMRHMQEHFTRMRNRRGTGRRDPNAQPRRGDRRQGDQLGERPPEDQLPPTERPPIDEMAPPPTEF